LGNFSTKELFMDILNFKSCKRTIKWEFGYWGGTLKRWYSEGLPVLRELNKNITYGETIAGAGFAYGGLTTGLRPERDFDVANYFKFDEGFEIVPFDYWLYPNFESKLIFENENYKEFYDIDGIRKKILKDDSSMPFMIEFPVKNYNDWVKVKEEKFNLDNISSRFPKYINNFLEKAKNRTFPLGLFYYPIGFFGSLRYLIGEEKLFLMYYDNPLLIKDIANHLCNLWIEIAEELITKIDIDIIVFWEDMSGKNGSLISPDTFREFMSPYYKKIIDFFKTKKITKFVVDTDGYVEKLIPLFMEVGINGIFPLEQQAGNDLLKIRGNYPDLVILGGFDKNTLFKGKEYIDKELEKMEFLIKRGGYIPFGDHLIPPNSSWENFKYYREKLNSIIDNVKIL